jgi:DNA-binding transcriptional regulator YiaG
MTLIDEDIRDDLKAWRARVGLTQSEAAARLGVNLRTYEAWEMGRHSPSTADVVRLAMGAIEDAIVAEKRRQRRGRKDS